MSHVGVWFMPAVARWTHLWCCALQTAACPAIERAVNSAALPAGCAGRWRVCPQRHSGAGCDGCTGGDDGCRGAVTPDPSRAACSMAKYRCEIRKPTSFDADRSIANILITFARHVTG